MTESSLQSDDPDRLSVTEQVTMKCCAVLGIHFSLSLLKAVLPHRSSAQIEHSVRVMVRYGHLFLDEHFYKTKFKKC